MPAWMMILMIGYAAMSLVSFVIYGWDKHRAVRAGWRVPESTLLLCDLLGGWPGGLVGQRVFRHKRRKRAYMVKFWAIVALHAIILGRVLGGEVL